LSFNPLITASACAPFNVFIAMMADDMPEIFGKGKGLHLLLPMWGLEDENSTDMRKALDVAKTKMPGHSHVVLASTEYEAYILGTRGVPTLFSHQGIFIDENVWRPYQKRFSRLGQFDAALNARFDKWKRHELASSIGRLLLVYAPSLDEGIEKSAQRMMATLPRAYFANRELRGESYSYLQNEEIAQLYGHADVGLCLSVAEGYNRASTEYMMCGLPVVSTRSTGGRDRYYENKYCRIVDANPASIANAVQELRQCNFPRSEVRKYLLDLLEFERGNFLRAFNRIVEQHFGIRDKFSSMKPFMSVKKDFSSHRDLLKQLKDQYNDQMLNRV
jgi:hypothetical protein